MEQNLDVENSPVSNLSPHILQRPLVEPKIFFEYLQIVRYRLVSIVVTMVGIGVLAFILASSMDQVYKATATLEIEPKTKQLTTIKDIYENSNFSREYLNTQLAVLNSRSLAYQVAQRVGFAEKLSHVENPMSHEVFSWQSYLPQLFVDIIYNSQEPQVQPATPHLKQIKVKNSMIKMVKDGLEINPVPFSRLVKISYESSSPQLAAAIPNLLVEVYINSGFESRKNITTKTSSWFVSRLEILKKKLQTSEQMLQIFLEKSDLLGSKKGGSIAEEQFAAIAADLRDAKRHELEISILYKQIESINSSTTDALLVIPQIMNDSVVKEHRLVLAKKQQMVAKLQTRYGPQHPTMVVALSELQSAKESLNQQIKTKVQAITNSYESAISKVKSIEKQYQNIKDELRFISRGNTQLSALKSEVEANREQYNLFLARVKQSDAVGDLQADNRQMDNARLIDPAETPILHSWPNTKLIVAKSMAFTFVMGVFLALLLDFLDNTIKGVRDVEVKLRTGVLGTLPLLKPSVKGQGELDLGWLFLRGSNSQFNEAIRTIRTSIRLSDVDKSHRIIVITSSVPQEGKSTVAMNIALAMGSMEKTLIIDCDLRKPSIAKFMRIDKNSAGLSNLVSKTQKKAACLYAVDGSGLTFLPTGSLPPNPQEFLSSQKFKNLLAELSQQFDRIIIDSPPSLTISDSFIVAALADAVIYICQADSTPIPVIQGTMVRFLQSQTPLIGVVLNKKNINQRSSYYYSHYGAQVKDGIKSPLH
ncbi:MAG: polysaccharide biosynthesis tyrosine autokinase [Magnetococcales bacterium]|nr:polysaccharide biosynthesis tyrosine autokinase [Magnetococcales bacterium]